MTTAGTRLAGIAGPRGWPIAGMAPALRRDSLTTLLAGFREYGDVVGYRLGPRRGPLRLEMVAVHHPDDVQRVLTRTEHGFGRQTRAFDVLAEVIGRGLLTTEGDQWRRQRRTLQPLFTPRRVSGYAGLMAAEAERIAIELPATSAVVDLHNLMLRYTLRVVGRALFGDDIDDTIEELTRLVPRATDVTHARTLQVARTPLAWPTPRNRRVVRLRAGLYAVVERILARRAGLAEDRDDLLTRLGAARDPDTGQPLTPREIRDQVLVFLAAGHETTASALTFTLHQLGCHPQLQDRVAGETAVTRAALLEGMRLFPPAYVVPRVVTEDTDVGGHPVPAGTAVLISPWVTHRHPAFWPDPERYDPGRFTTGNDRPRYAYFPFGGGPHACIGEHFALLEAEVLLRTILARTRVDSLDPRPRLSAHVVLRPAAPVLVRLTPR